MVQLYAFSDKKFNGTTLTNVTTVAYKLIFGAERVLVEYNAVVWKKESPSDHWNRRKSINWANERLAKYPLAIDFGKVQHFPHYYQFRRLERYLLRLVYNLGLSWINYHCLNPLPLYDIFNPQLTEHEQQLEKEYEQSLPMFGYRRSRFNQLNKVSWFSQVVEPFVRNFSFSFTQNNSNTKYDVSRPQQLYYVYSNREKYDRAVKITECCLKTILTSQNEIQIWPNTELWDFLDYGAFQQRVAQGKEYIVQINQQTGLKERIQLVDDKLTFAILRNWDWESSKSVETVDPDHSFTFWSGPIGSQVLVAEPSIGFVQTSVNYEPSLESDSLLIKAIKREMTKYENGEMVEKCITHLSNSDPLPLNTAGRYNMAIGDCTSAITVPTPSLPTVSWPTDPQPAVSAEPQPTESLPTSAEPQPTESLPTPTVSAEPQPINQPTESLPTPTVSAEPQPINQPTESLPTPTVSAEPQQTNQSIETQPVSSTETQPDEPISLETISAEPETPKTKHKSTWWYY